MVGDLVLGYLLKEKIGSGKASVSYLSTKDGLDVVLKVMHGKPYENGHVFTVWDELKAYHQLIELGIDVPKLITYDHEQQVLVKPYVKGMTAAALIAEGDLRIDLYPELFKGFLDIESKGYTIDYFPANFVLYENRFVYIDYEINPYEAPWNLFNWGIHFWFNSKGFKVYLEKDHDHSYLIDPDHQGYPLKHLTKEAVEDFLKQHPHLKSIS
jgi:tRNA A-37 threonylcarbamoyl transferase component Bud32